MAFGPNMGYCKFHNTLLALEQCLEDWDNDEGEEEAREELVRKCYEVVLAFGDGSEAGAMKTRLTMPEETDGWTEMDEWNARVSDLRMRCSSGIEGALGVEAGRVEVFRKVCEDVAILADADGEHREWAWKMLMDRFGQEFVKAEVAEDGSEAMAWLDVRNMMNGLIEEGEDDGEY